MSKNIKNKLLTFENKSIIISYHRLLWVNLRRITKKTVLQRQNVGKLMVVLDYSVSFYKHYQFREKEISAINTR